MTAAEFYALLVLAVAMSFSPGPNTTLAATLGANHGLKRTLPFVCSVPLGWGALLALCTLGLGALLFALPWLGHLVKAIGVGYLVWLAWKISRPPHAADPQSSQSATADVGFWQGVALQFVNIKAWMLALAIVSGWIAGRENPGLRFALVLPVMLLLAFASNLAYAAVGSLLRDWLNGPDRTAKRLLWFNRVMGLVLLVTAIWMAWL